MSDNITKLIERASFLKAINIFHGQTGSLDEFVQEVEKAVILNMMVLTGDNQSVAARALGISRTKLIYKLKEFKQCKLCEGVHGNNTECQRSGQPGESWEGSDERS